MKKKDIYEHLAHIYLDASSTSKKKRKTRRRSQILQKAFIFVMLIIGASFMFSYLNREAIIESDPNSDTALVLCYDPVKINFHFDPAKKEIYSIKLNKLDLSKFKALAFSAKKSNFLDTLSLRVEFVNVFREKSEVYIKQLPHKWQDYKIDLADFKNMSRWSGMLNLSFVVEEWNVTQKRGEVYLDNIRFLR